MKKLNRRQAWRYLQKKFEKWKPNKGGIIYSGLCYAIKGLNCQDRITWVTRNRMMDDVKSIGRSMGFVGATHYFWTIDASGAKHRVEAINTILKKGQQ